MASEALKTSFTSSSVGRFVHIKLSELWANFPYLSWIYLGDRLLKLLPKCQFWLGQHLLEYIEVWPRWKLNALISHASNFYQGCES